MTATSTTKRKRTRKTEDELIAEYEAKIARIEDLKRQEELRSSPVRKDFEKFKKQAAKFAQACVDNQRNDVANSTLALINTIERQVKDS